MTGVEMRSLGFDVNVGRHDTVEVTPADDYSEDDTSLIDAIGIVGDPGESVGNTGVDTHGAEECPCVLDFGVGGADQQAEAYNAQGRNTHTEIASETASIRKPTD